MRQRNLINGLLFAAALALGAVVMLGTPQGDGSVRARLTPLTPSEVQTLEIEYPPAADAEAGDDGTIVLERRDGGWHLTRPLERPALDRRIVTALSGLSAASACYSLLDRDPAEYGLAQPRLRLRADDRPLSFGDRTQDGRRYVRAGSRMCLLEDRTLPLLAQGIEALANPALLPEDAEPLAIEIPWARAERADNTNAWSSAGLDAVGASQLSDWTARWLAAHAESFVLTPPAADHGRIRIATADGQSHQWRIAQMPPELVLVPAGADYGLRITAERAEALLRPYPTEPTAADADTPAGQ